MLHARGQSTAELQKQHVDRLHRHTIHTTSAGMAHANGPTARATVNSTSWWWGQEQRVVLNFGDAGTTQKAMGATSAQIDFVCVICTSNSSTAAVASLSLPLSVCVSLFKGTSHVRNNNNNNNNDIAIYLPALLFFRSYNEEFVQTAFIPYYLSTDIDFVCVLCTSSSAAAVAIFLSLSLSVCLCSGVPHTTISPFLYLPFYFFAATTKCLYKRHLLPTSLLASIIFRCDHGPDSLHAVICDKLTFFTGGCSEGLGAFRFFLK